MPCNLHVAVDCSDVTELVCWNSSVLNLTLKSPSAETHIRVSSRETFHLFGRFSGLNVFKNMSFNNTSSSEGSDSETSDLRINDLTVGQKLKIDRTSLSILEFIGEGSFGKVAKCHDASTDKIVAVKMLKSRKAKKKAANEADILDCFKGYRFNQSYLIHFYYMFEYRGLTCLSFEMLDKSLWQALSKRKQPMSVQEIRPIAQQLLAALDALKSARIIHTDIKPDNIMFVDMKNQPLRVKLIDFGEATESHRSQRYYGRWFQAISYRAPEVYLGLPISEAIDVFSVGLTLAFLYLKQPLFPYGCVYDVMKTMVDILEFPERLLTSALYTECFFKKTKAKDSSSTWRFVTPKEFTTVTHMTPMECHPSPFRTLYDLIYMYPSRCDGEYKDKEKFVELLEGLLDMDQKTRMSPNQGLMHSFINMTHLSTAQNSQNYLRKSEALMDPFRIRDKSAEIQFFQVADPSDNSSSVSSYDSDKDSITIESTSSCDSSSSAGDEEMTFSNIKQSSRGPPLSADIESPPASDDELGSLKIEKLWRDSLSSTSVSEELTNIHPSAFSLTSDDEMSSFNLEALWGGPPSSADEKKTTFSNGMESSRGPLSSAVVLTSSSSSSPPVVGQELTPNIEKSTKSGTIRRGLRSVRKFFKRVLTAVCCCVSPEVDI